MVTVSFQQQAALPYGSDCEKAWYRPAVRKHFEILADSQAALSKHDVTLDWPQRV